MISNEQHDVVPSVSGRRAAQPVGLSEFDGQRMAVILNRGTRRTVLRGKAAFVRDDLLGNTLSIRLEDTEPGDPVLIISEGEWNGRIIPDFHYGCDFCLIVG